MVRNSYSSYSVSHHFLFPLSHIDIIEEKKDRCIVAINTFQSTGITSMNDIEEASRDRDASYRSRSSKEVAKNSSKEDITKEMLKKHSAFLQEKYQGGIRQSRILNSKILSQAPEGYFDRYLPIVRRATEYTQGYLVDNDLVGSISEAKNNPTDDFFQDVSFQAVAKGVRSFFELTREASNLEPVERYLIIQMVVNEIVGFSVLDPLWRDNSITEIICNGPNDVQIEHRGVVRKVPAAKFRDPEHLETLIERLYASIGRTVSPTHPLRKGRLPDRSRMMATHRVVSPEGPNLNIRRHPEEFWTPEDLINYGSANEELLTDIGNLIHKGCSFILSGGASTGKTSTLNALTGFYRNDLRMLTLEDNLEMKPNPNKLWSAAMECNVDTLESGVQVGVSMRDLVRASLQMRPDGIVIGEVTDGAMYDLCQALNTGHFGASTVHANDEESAIHRIVSLVSESEVVTERATLPLVAAAFDFIIQLERNPIDGSRRIVAVSEILPNQELDEGGVLELRTSPLWKFETKGINKQGKIVGEWVKVGEMSARRQQLRRLNHQEDLNWEELKKLSGVDSATVSQIKNI